MKHGKGRKAIEHPFNLNCIECKAWLDKWYHGSIEEVQQARNEAYAKAMNGPYG